MTAMAEAAAAHGSDPLRKATAMVASGLGREAAMSASQPASGAQFRVQAGVSHIVAACRPACVHHRSSRSPAAHGLAQLLRLTGGSEVAIAAVSAQQKPAVALPVLDWLECHPTAGHVAADCTPMIAASAE